LDLIDGRFHNFNQQSFRRNFFRNAKAQLEFCVSKNKSQKVSHLTFHNQQQQQQRVGVCSTMIVTLMMAFFIAQLYRQSVLMD